MYQHLYHVQAVYTQATSNYNYAQYISDPYNTTEPVLLFSSNKQPT